MADEPAAPIPDPEENKGGELQHHDRFESHEPLPDEMEEDDGGPVKPFLEHLEDLRWVLVKIVVSIIVGMTICLIGADKLVKFMQWPLHKAGININLELFGPVGGFMMAMKMAFWGGLCISLPYILFVIAQFVMPALKKNEKPYFRKAFVIGGGLFILGVILCYGVITPIALKGMLAFNQWLGFNSTMWRAEEYFQFLIMFMVGMGLSFEVPVLILTLVKIGLISHELLVKSRVYIFIGNMVLCAFITPDAISTIFMVIPVAILMEICIQISGHWERQKRIKEAKDRDSLR